MDFNQYTSQQVIIDCSRCQNPSTVEKWDEVGKKTWIGYIGIMRVLKASGITGIHGYEYKCPSCGTIASGSRLYPYVAMTSNKEALSLLRKGDS